jgi:hypothetical protein
MAARMLRWFCMPPLGLAGRAGCEEQRRHILRPHSILDKLGNGKYYEVFQRPCPTIAAEYQYMLKGRKDGLCAANMWRTLGVSDEDAGLGLDHELVEFGRTIHRAHWRRDRTNQWAGVIRRRQVQAGSAG